MLCVQHWNTINPIAYLLTGRIHFHLDLGVGTQHPIVDVFVQILHAIPSRRLESQFAQRHRHIGRCAIRSPVNKGHRVRVVGLRDRRNGSRPDFDALVLVDAASLDAERILVNGDDLAVLQDRLVLGSNGAQVDGHEQRGGHNGPQGELGFGLLEAEAKVADDQLERTLRVSLGILKNKWGLSHHIWIVPMSWSCVGHNLILVVAVIVDDCFQRCPRVLNIIVVAPQVAMLNDRRKVWLIINKTDILLFYVDALLHISSYRYSSINLVHRPTTRINHLSSGAVQKASKLRIPMVHIYGQCIASVQLHIVDVPIGKLLRIVPRVSDDSRIPGASVVAIVLVNAEFETACMDL